MRNYIYKLRWFLVTVLLLVFCQRDGHAQNHHWYLESPIKLEIAGRLDRSVYGVHRGLQAGLRIKDRWGFSYVRHATVASEQGQMVYKGVETSYTFNPKGQLQFQVIGAVGIHNQFFVAFQPRLQVRYNLSPHYFVAAGVSRQDTYPYLSLKAGLTLFKSR